MEAFGIYLLKSTGVLFLFYSCYYLFLRKETFFNTNRSFLLSGMLVSLFLPLIYFTREVYVNFSPIQEGKGIASSVAIAEENVVNGPLILLCIYLLGSLFFLFKLLVEITQIQKFVKEGQKKHTNGFIFVESKKNIQPFSFFNYIIYNPKKHTSEELSLILAHEQVHAKEKHSFDILFMQILMILQWYSPVVWLYKSIVNQNLEFLADSKNTAVDQHRKKYQYMLVTQAVGKQNLSIVNPFFNSLIKKRIVMINQIPSKKIKTIKTLLILPLLCLFLYSFNVKTVYSVKDMPKQASAKSIELTITKNTSNEQLEAIKNDLKKDGIDFSYTVVHNSKDEIVDISIQVAGKSENGGSFNNSYVSSEKNGVINPVVILIDLENNLVSIGSKGTYNSNTVKIHTDDDQVWIGSGEGMQKEIRIIEKNGEKTVIVDGEEVDEEELDDMEITVGKSSNVFIRKDSNDESDIQVISKKGNGFFFIDNEDARKPLYIIDGKEVKSKKVEDLIPDNIASIRVLKSKKAIEKYGKKGEDGVIIIETKKN